MNWVALTTAFGAGCIVGCIVCGLATLLMLSLFPSGPEGH